MESEFITLPDDVETLQKLLLEKEKRIQELIFENLSLKKSDPCDSIEELDVELDENAETIDLKHFEGDLDDDDDGESFPNLGENVNQGDFMNILKMLLTQEGTYGHKKSEGFPDPNPSLNSNEDGEEEGDDEEEGYGEEEGDDEEEGYGEEEGDDEEEGYGEEEEDVIEDLPVD